MLQKNNYFDLLKYVYENGKNIIVKNEEIKEVINVNLMIDNPKNCIFYFDETKRSYDYVMKYLHGELCWYFNGSNDVENILKYSKFWENIVDYNGKVNSNYGYHVFYKKLDFKKTNYENCVELLKNDINSRRVVMLYNEPKFMFNNPRDYVCTQTQQFFIREKKLDCIINIRSSDAIFGLTYDIPWWSLVQQYLSKELKVELGFLSINIGSSHIYSRFYDFMKTINWDKTKTSSMSLIKKIPLKNSFNWYEKNINSFLEFKK